jgi:hypothetical protein
MRSLLVIAAILAAAALPAVALSSTAPTRDQRVELRKAVKSSKLVSRSVRKHFSLFKPRVSDNGRWAKAGILPTNGYSDPFNAPKGLFKHKQSGGWKLVKYGTRGIGCSKPRLSRSVRRDLKLRCKS